MFTILVTGVGSIIGYGIIGSLRRSEISTRIIGIDINSDAYGRWVSDHFITGVRASSQDFIPLINRISEDYKIDLVIPGIEQDLFALWDNRDRIKTRVVFNSDVCIGLSRNKYETYRYLSQFDIRLIPTLKDSSYKDCVNVLGLPFLLKPLSSSASKGIETIYNEDEFNFYTRKNAGCCIYQKIVGSPESEYTVAVFGNGAGQFFDYIILKRKLSGEGATQKAVMTEDEDILDYVKHLCRILKPEGPTNIQLRKEGSKVYLLEINARISSACSIRTLMGYNDPEMCIKYYLINQKIKPSNKIPGKVIRYISDNFIHQNENSNNIRHSW